MTDQMTDHPHDDGVRAAECTWCPLCQFIAVLRGERPEVTERVAEAGAALAAALRAFLDATSNAGAPSGHHHPEGRPGSRPRVQRIDLRDEP